MCRLVSACWRLLFSPAFALALYGGFFAADGAFGSKAAENQDRATTAVPAMPRALWADAGCQSADFTQHLRGKAAFQMARLRMDRPKGTMKPIGSVPMPDLIYLFLGLAGFALAVLAVSAIERM